MITKIEGIIVSETPYGDSSKIINVLTKEHGIIGIMCHGVKSIKSPLRTKTIKFTYGFFHIDYKEKRLSKLIDIDIIDNFKNIKESIELISYTAYLNELTLQVLKQNDDNEIFELYINALKKINEKQNPMIITNIIELKYLDFLGVGLNLDSCVKCGSKKNIVTLDADEGGYICSNCYLNEPIMSPKAIKMIRMYYLVEINSITNINISPSLTNEINRFLDKYYERYTGLYLKSKDFLRRITNL